MADLVIRVTDSSTAGSTQEVRVTPQESGRNIRDVNPNSITEAEATQALNVVETYLNGRPEHSVDLSHLGIQVGRRNTTLDRLRSTFTSLQSRIDGIRQNTHVIQAATPPATPPAQAPQTPPTQAPDVTQNAPQQQAAQQPQAPQTPPVVQAPQNPTAPITPSITRSRWNLLSNLSLNALRQGGNNGGFTYVGTNVDLGFGYDLATGSAGSFGLFALGRFTHIGGRGYTSVADINGGGIVAGLRARIRAGNIVNIDASAGGSAQYIGGSNQLPGLPYSSSISGFTGGFFASLGILFNLGSSGFSMGPSGHFNFTYTPNGQNAFGNNFDNSFLGIGGGLTLAYTPTPAVNMIQGREVCDSGETPARILSEINELRTALLGDSDPNGIEGLREENGRLRDMVRANVEGMGLSNTQLLSYARQGYARYLESRNPNPVTDAATRSTQAQAEYPDGTDFTNPSAIAPNDIPNPLNAEHCSSELIDLRDRLQRERNELERQNGKLEGILIGLLIQRGIPAAAAPAVLQTITLLDFPSINFQQGAPHASGTRAQTQEHQNALNYLAGFTSPAVPAGVTGNPPAANSMTDVQRTQYAEAVRQRAQQIASNPQIRNILGNPTADARFIANVANILLGYELPNTVGTNNREGIRQVLMQMPVILESHASAEGAADAADARAHHARNAETNNNLALTERRAAFMVAFIKALGVPENRLRGAGYGESRLLIDETGLRRQALTYAQARNRRTRVVADLERMDPTTGRALTPPPTPQTTTTGDAGVSGDASTTSDAGSAADVTDASVPNG